MSAETLGPRPSRLGAARRAPQDEELNLQGGLSQRVRPEVAGTMTGSAKPTRIFPVYQNAWARRSAPLPTLRAFTSSSST